VKLDLARADARLREKGTPGLLQILHAATGRTARNLRAETATLGKGAARTALALADRHLGAAVGFLQAAAAAVEACRGELFELARSEGLDRLSAELDVLARCIEMAERNEHPLRLANFARRATGSTKGLRAGDRRYMPEALIAKTIGGLKPLKGAGAGVRRLLDEADDILGEDLLAAGDTEDIVMEIGAVARLDERQECLASRLCLGCGGLEPSGGLSRVGDAVVRLLPCPRGGVDGGPLSLTGSIEIRLHPLDSVAEFENSGADD
jgi:hypothetical protein